MDYNLERLTKELELIAFEVTKSMGLITYRSQVEVTIKLTEGFAGTDSITQKDWDTLCKFEKWEEFCRWEHHRYIPRYKKLILTLREKNNEPIVVERGEFYYEHLPRIARLVKKTHDSIILSTKTSGQQVYIYLRKKMPERSKSSTDD